VLFNDFPRTIFGVVSSRVNDVSSAISEVCAIVRILFVVFFEQKVDALFYRLKSWGLMRVLQV